MSLTYEDLRAGVAGGAAGVRCRIVLQPLGGRGDKVFPPTYGVVDDSKTKYAKERRRVPKPDAHGDSADGDSMVVDAVVLDSVASQANRFEAALLDAVRRGDLALPITSVDFAQSGLPGFDKISDTRRRTRGLPDRRTSRLRAPGHPVMSRRRYLVAYDIRDDKRLRSIAVFAEAYGTRVQGSVTICDLSDSEKFAMRSDLESRMNQSEDSFPCPQGRAPLRLQPGPCDPGPDGAFSLRPRQGPIAAGWTRRRRSCR